MSDTKFTRGEWKVSGCGLVVNVNGHKVARAHSGRSVPYTSPSKANALLISKAPKMYEMLESVASELYMLIDEVNDQRASRINYQTETEPDYHDMQTLHEIQCLLTEARGEK